MNRETGPGPLAHDREHPILDPGADEGEGGEHHVVPPRVGKAISGSSASGEELGPDGPEVVDRIGRATEGRATERRGRGFAKGAEPCSAQKRNSA